MFSSLKLCAISFIPAAPVKAGVCMDVNILGAPNQPTLLRSDVTLHHHMARENTGRGCVLMKNFISDESRKNILPPLPTRHCCAASAR
jgi:hypothetical protein